MTMQKRQQPVGPLVSNSNVLVGGTHTHTHACMYRAGLLDTLFAKVMDGKGRQDGHDEDTKGHGVRRLALGRDVSEVDPRVELGMVDVVLAVGGEESLLLLDAQQTGQSGELVDDISVVLVVDHELLLVFKGGAHVDGTVGVRAKQELQHKEDHGEETDPGVEGHHVGVGMVVVLGDDGPHGDGGADDGNDPADRVDSLAHGTGKQGVVLEGQRGDAHEDEGDVHEERVPVKDLGGSSGLDEPNVVGNQSDEAPEVSGNGGKLLHLAELDGAGVGEDFSLSFLQGGFFGGLTHC